MAVEELPYNEARALLDEGIREGGPGDVYIVSLDGGQGGTTCVRVDAGEADPDRAARRWAVEWARDGDWDVSRGTVWCSVRVERMDGGYERERRVAIDPEEPACAEGHSHDWRSPYSLLGGLRENPGVQGHGGGAVVTEACAHCGRYRVTDSWAQDPETGEQGLESVAYRDADEDSLAWVGRRAAARV